jgi:hypothetical protein
MPGPVATCNVQAVRGYVAWLNEQMIERWIIDSLDVELFNDRFKTQFTKDELMHMWYNAPDGRKQLIWYF